MFFNMHFLTEENSFLLKQKPAPNLPTYNIFDSLQSRMTSQLPLDCTNLFSQRSEIVLIVETRFKAFLSDINELLSIKTTLQQFLLI